MFYLYIHNKYIEYTTLVSKTLCLGSRIDFMKDFIMNLLNLVRYIKLTWQKPGLSPINICYKGTPIEFPSWSNLSLCLKYSMNISVIAFPIYIDTTKCKAR